MVKRNSSSLGIDLSDRTANFCAMHVESGVTAEGKIPLTVSALTSLWHSYATVDVVVLEAGTPSTWVTELLQSLGARVIVADPRKLKAVTDSVRKSDQRDARMLSRLGLADETLLSPTYVRPTAHRKILLVLKARDQQVRARTATILEIRSQLKREGFRLPGGDARNFHQHEGLVPEELAPLFAPLFRSLRALSESIDAYDQMIVDAGKTLPIVAKLDVIDGVGPITALAFVVVVGTPDRFPHTRDIGAYLGLVPKRDQSGQSDPVRRISKAGCGLMRRLLVQCAHHLIQKAGKDTALRRRAQAHLARVGKTGKRRVVVGLARKLAVLMLSLWKSGQDWQPLHRVPAPPEDVPQPVDATSAPVRSGPLEAVAKTAPSPSTRTQTCTGGASPTTSADGSMGRMGTSPVVAPRKRPSPEILPAPGSARPDASPVPTASGKDRQERAIPTPGSRRDKHGRFVAKESSMVT